MVAQHAADMAVLLHDDLIAGSSAPVETDSWDSVDSGIADSVSVADIDYCLCSSTVATTGLLALLAICLPSSCVAARRTFSNKR